MMHNSSKQQSTTTAILHQQRLGDESKLSVENNNLIINNLIIKYALEASHADNEFADKIRQITTRFSPPRDQLRVFENGRSVTIDELIKEMQILNRCSQNKAQWKTLKEEEKLALEKYKLFLMQATQEHLLARTQFTLPDNENAPLPKPSKLRWFLFGAFLLLEFIPAIWGGFLGVNALLSAVPWLSPTTVAISAITVCGIEAVLYYAVMGPLLKEALGIPTAGLASLRLETYGEQHQVLKNIDAILTAENNLCSAEYAQYARLAGLLSTHIQDVQQTEMKPYQETTAKKGLRWLLTGLNMLLNIGGGYFFALSLLAGTAATAALIGTPIGWGIVGLVIVGQLALRLAVRSNGMFNILNPEAERHEQVRKKIAHFQSNTLRYTDILTNKKSHETLLNRQEARKNPYIDSYPGPSYVNLSLLSPTTDRTRLFPTAETREEKMNLSIK